MQPLPQVRYRAIEMMMSDLDKLSPDSDCFKRLVVDKVRHGIIFESALSEILTGYAKHGWFPQSVGYDSDGKPASFIFWNDDFDMSEGEDMATWWIEVHYDKPGELKLRSHKPARRFAP